MQYLQSSYLLPSSVSTSSYVTNLSRRGKPKRVYGVTRKGKYGKVHGRQKRALKRISRISYGFGNPMTGGLIGSRGFGLRRFGYGNSGLAAVAPIAILGLG